MVEILQDLSPASLVTAFEENLSSWMPVFGRLGRTVVDDPPGVKRSITDIPYALVNSVVDTRLAPEQVDVAAERIVSDARSRNVPVMWWICPGTRPIDLGEHLEAHGFVLDEEAPVMAIALEDLNEHLPTPEGLSIRLAEDDASWRLHGHISALAYGAPASRVSFVTDVWHDILSQADPELTRVYIAWWRDSPVATSLLLLGGGVAGIWGVATVPEARRKGIGTQVTLRPLLQARAMGFRAGVLGASEMGFGVYHSLGFRQYGTKRAYAWRPTS